MDAYQDNNQLKIEESNRAIQCTQTSHRGPCTLVLLMQLQAVTGKGKVANPTGAVALHQSVSW